MADRLRFSDYTRVRPEPVRWLWPGRLPAGKLVLLDGDPDVGKSTVAMDVAAKLTTGGLLPDGWMPDRPTRVLMLRGEDGRADTVLPRLLAAGGDPASFLEIDGVPFCDEAGNLGLRSVELPTDIAALEALVVEQGVGLVLVDVLMVFLSDRVNAHKDQHIRRALSPLSAMAERTGASILALRHLNKVQMGPVLYRGGGSIGIIGAARAGLLAGIDPDDTSRRLLAVSKSNLSKRYPTLAYRIVGDDRYQCGSIQWEGTSERSAADMLRLSLFDDDERGRVEEAVRVLFEVMSDGPMPGNDVVKECRAAGVSELAMRKAKDVIGVVVFKEKGQQGRGRWLWRLPDVDLAVFTDEGEFLGERIAPEEHEGGDG